MAVTSAGFKQQCPTCETMVLIRDQKQIGKKMECPKCKDRFVVEAPADDEVEETNGKAIAKKNGKAAPAGKPKKRFREDDDDADDQDADEQPQGKGRFRDDEADEDDEATSKKKSGGSKKTLPFILAGVGLVVLIVAAVFIIMSRSDAPSTPSTPNTGLPGTNNQGGAKNEEKKEPPKNEQQAAPQKGLAAAGAELTNLLPNDTEHVLHVNFKDIFDNAHPYRELIFGAGALQDEDLKRKLGFSPTALDTLIRADKYSGAGWTYTVMHFTESIDEKAFTEAFGLKPAAPINRLPYFQASKINPSFNELARLSLGVPSSQRNMVQRPDRPMSVRFHNAQTVIVGDEAPVAAFLQANSQFKLLTELGAAPSSATPGQPQNPGIMPMSPMPGGPQGLSPMPGAQPGLSPMPGIQPGAVPMPMGDPMGLPNKPSGRGGASLRSNGDGSDFAAVGDDGNFGEPQYAQVAPSLLPLEGQGPGNVSPMPMGGMPKMTMPMGGNPMMGMPNMGGGQAAPPQNAAVRSKTWLTIRPELKAIMDRLQNRTDEAKDKVMFASATDMAGARLDTSRMPEFRNRILWHPRQLWDITQLMEERKARVKALGTALLQRDLRVFQYRTEIVCAQDADARELHKELIDKAAPQIAKAIDRLLDQKVEIPKNETPAADPTGVPQVGPGLGPNVGPMIGPNPMGGKPMIGPMPQIGPGPMGTGGVPMIGPMPGVGPTGGLPSAFPGAGADGLGQPAAPKEELAKSSKLTLTQRGSSIDMKLDLVLDGTGFGRFTTLVNLLALTLKSEVELASGGYGLHDLASSIKMMGKRGNSERNVGPGRYPPAALKRTGGTRLDQQPYNRMSWLSALLPYLGHDALYQKIEFDGSWREPRNWLAARTIVPQFLDPQYPDHTRFATPPGVGVEMAATHFVGIAGVGLDAAEYSRNDPAYLAKRGVFSYDGAATIAEIGKGRGLSNTAVAIQIPHDGLTGVAPWIAGGGGTVRGVPESNSIAPFVLSTDRNGRPIQYKGKRGTHVFMADGSVRFVTDKVSDDVFKAMATINGPTPVNFDLNKNLDTPLVPKDVAKEIVRAAPVINEKPVQPTISYDKPPPNESGGIAGWIKFDVPGAGFSVSMPGTPLALDQQPVPGGPKVKVYIAVEVATQSPYTAILVPMDAKMKSEYASNADQMFRNFAAGMAGVTGQNVQEKRVAVGSLQGREFAMREPKTGKQLFMRAFVHNNNLAVVMAAGDQPTPNANVQAYLNSVKLSK